MEVSIKLAIDFNRPMPVEETMVDISIKGMSLVDAHSFSDMRPLIATNLEYLVDRAGYSEGYVRDLKEIIKTLVYGSSAG